MSLSPFTIEEAFDTKGAAAAIAELQNIEIVANRRYEVFANAGRRLAPDVKAELAVSYQRSGLAIAGDFSPRKDGDKPGLMYEAFVLNVIVSASDKGIFCQAPGNYPRHVYERAGIYQYGGVIGLGKTTKGSHKTKIRLQSAANFENKSLGAGVRVVASTRFFSLEGDQIDRLALKYAQYFREEAERVMRRG